MANGSDGLTDQAALSVPLLWTLKRPPRTHCCRIRGTTTWALCNLFSSALGLLSKNLSHVNTSTKQLLGKQKNQKLKFQSFYLRALLHPPPRRDRCGGCWDSDGNTHFETLQVIEHPGHGDGFCFAYFCQKRQVAFVSFSSVQPPINKGQVGIAFGNSSSLNNGIGERDTCRAHTENCLPSAHFLDMLRPVGRVLSFWPAVNPIEQQPWLGHTQHFFCLKDDLVSKGQIVEFPKNN